MRHRGLYRSRGLPKHRSFGHGHSYGVLYHYYRREAGVELREDVQTELRRDMVVSMEPMIMIPEDEPGAVASMTFWLSRRTSRDSSFGFEHNVIGN